MTKIFEAAWEFHLFFEKNLIPYVIIGGVAVQRWGRPRMTTDVDFTISVPVENSESTIKLLISHFSPRYKDLFDFALKHRIVLLRASNGTGVDVSLALPGYEDQLIKRAVSFEIEPGKIIRLCSAEDLVIHKLVAGRVRDIEDVQSVIKRVRETLDVDYVRHWLTIFSNFLESNEPLLQFERLIKETSAR